MESIVAPTATIHSAHCHEIVLRWNQRKETFRFWAEWLILVRTVQKTTDLLELDFAFSQQALLTPEQFISECKRREPFSTPGLHLIEQLEALHEAQILIPLYRFVKNIDPIFDEAKRRGLPLISVIAPLSDQAAFSHYLDGHTEIGYPVDPRTEPFEPRFTYGRKLRGQLFWTSGFFYSPYQLLLIPILRELIPKMKVLKTPRKFATLGLSYTLDINNLGEQTVSHYKKEVQNNDELVFLLTALDAKYRPQITGRFTNYRGIKLDSWFDYELTFDPSKMLSWLGWDVERIRKTSEELLFTADHLDPISEWSRLVRLVSFQKLDKLRGDALLAIDHRIAAELLLLFYEDLYNKGEAPPLEPIPKKFYAARSHRLRTERKELDQVLMDFGISPHPSLVLVLEGQTELFLVPRVFDLMGIPLRQDQIEIFNAGGINRDFGLLAKYAITPKLGETIEKGYLLTRPPTRFLVVLDPEGAFKTSKAREKKRKAWVLDIWTAIPATEREHIPRREIDQLVEVKTWNRKVESFEFAHFTNRQLAAAILSVYKGPSAPSLTDLLYQIGICRTTAHNLENLWRRWKGIKPTKGRLAEALWPILENKIKRASAQSRRRLPVVRIVLHAYRQAISMHRASVMIRSKKNSPVV